MRLKSIQTLLLLTFLLNTVCAEELSGPRQVAVPDMNLRMDLPAGWSVLFATPKDVKGFFIKSLDGSVRTLRVREVRKEEATEIDVTMNEYKRVQALYADRPEVRFQVDDRGRTRSGYFLHFTQIHPRLGESKGFIGCKPLGNSRFLLGTGDGILARVGHRKGLEPNDPEMLEMRKVWSQIQSI